MASGESVNHPNCQDFLILQTSPESVAACMNGSAPCARVFGRVMR
jgi:hypothetical protein